VTEPLDPRVPQASAAGFSTDMAVYERGRPSYPDDVIEWLVEGLGIGAGRRVVDLAAGTGKLTRLLAPTGADITAVEPSAAMRAELGRNLPGVPILDGTAEAMPFADASVDVVTVGQAFHWFDVPRATAEISRVLARGGGLGFVWNERDVDAEPWVAELSRLIRWEQRLAVGVPMNVELDWQQIFAERAVGFGPLERLDTTYRQELDVDTLVERVLSTSYIASAPADEQRRIEDAVRSITAGFPERFELPYVTVAYRGVRI
jgi:ubiquinone/menaquinone biosynthesis C-methylase UbiE